MTKSMTAFARNQQNLDEGKQTLELSDGWRCQYNNPDFPFGNSYQEDQCFLGFTATANNENDWHKHTLSWLNEKGEVTLDYRPVHMYTLSDECEVIPPKKRVY